MDLNDGVACGEWLERNNKMIDPICVFLFVLLQFDPSCWKWISSPQIDYWAPLPTTTHDGWHCTCPWKKNQAYVKCTPKKEKLYPWNYSFGINNPTYFEESLIHNVKTFRSTCLQKRLFLSLIAKLYIHSVSLLKSPHSPKFRQYCPVLWRSILHSKHDANKHPP